VDVILELDVFRKLLFDNVVKRENRSMCHEDIGVQEDKTFKYLTVVFDSLEEHIAYFVLGV